MLKILKIYKGIFYLMPFSPLSMGGVVCRYNPTCSEYTYQAIQKYGIILGTLRAVKRITSCHPWGNFKNDPLV